MNLQNQGPVFVPFEFSAEIEKLSKAALMDMAWDYAKQQVSDGENPDLVMAEIRSRSEIILHYRKQAAEDRRAALLAERKTEGNS